MEGEIQEPEMKGTMQFMDMHDDAMKAIFNRLDDDDLINVAHTCKRLQQLLRHFLPQKYKNSLKIISPDSKEVSLRTEDHNDRPCPSIDAVVRLYPHIEIFHLDTNDSWEELIPIALHLKQLKELDLQIYVLGWNHIFYSAERIERMLCIAFEKKLPVQRLKMDMEFGYATNMLWMISENLPQLKELELHFHYVAYVGDIEDEDDLRFKPLEKLTVHVYSELTSYGLAIQSIAMFDFDQLKEFTLVGLHAPPEDVIKFIVRQKTLQKLKFIESIDVTADVFEKLGKELPQLKEMVVDVNDQSKELLNKHLGHRWMISNHSEIFNKKLKSAWSFKRI